MNGLSLKIRGGFLAMALIAAAATVYGPELFGTGTQGG